MRMGTGARPSRQSQYHLLIGRTAGNLARIKRQASLPHEEPGKQSHLLPIPKLGVSYTIARGPGRNDIGRPCVKFVGYVGQSEVCLPIGTCAANDVFWKYF